MKKTISIFLIIVFPLIFLGACASKRIVEEKEKIVYVDKIVKDSIFIEKTIIKNDTIENEITIECDSASFAQKFKDGNTDIKIVKENGKVVIKYVKQPAEIRYETKYIERKEKSDSIVSEKDTKHTEVIKEATFWQKLKNSAFQIGFFVILFLWILNITPIQIFKKYV